MTSTTLTSSARSIDARGARFAALITSAVLALALIFETPLLLILQTAIFFSGAFMGPDRTPYALLFRGWIAPKLRGKPQPEPVEPVQFAQRVGLAFAMAGLAGALVWPALFFVATALAFMAAFLNAAFGYCLGCQMYLVISRIRSRTAH